MTQKQNTLEATIESLSRQPETPPNKWAVLIINSVGVFMATLDSSIVNISLPKIAENFHVPMNGAIQWVIIAYLVAATAILLTAGRLADMFGRKTVWLAGLIIFTGGSALCGLAPSLGFLIAARILQGFGGSLVMAVGPALLTGAFPPQERGRALGLNAITVSLGVSIGPTLGGFITAYWTWRWIFFINLPIGILGLLATLRILKETTPRKESQFDPLGAILLAVGMASLTGGLSFGQDIGWSSPVLISIFVLAAIALLALPLVETRVANPIIDFSLFRNRVFFSANISLILSSMALFVVSFMLPFYLEELRGIPTQNAGLLLTPLPITIACVAPFSGALADKIGTRWLAAGGLAIACIGLICIGQLNEKSSIPDIIWRLMLTGFGQALFQSPNSSALMGSAPSNRQGIASGFLATARTMGQSISVALSGAIFATLGGAAAGHMLQVQQLTATQQAEQQHIFTHSFQIAFIVCAVIAAIGVFTSLVRGKEERRQRAAA